MRTLVDIPDAQLGELAGLCRRDGVSRAAAIRAAITAYLADRAAPAGEAFGLWGADGPDGLAYQDKVRSEW
jgi:metal-responsive CopG/Arc/MetJ family transcriptional regulator